MNASPKANLTSLEWQNEYLRGDESVGRWYQGAPFDPSDGIAARPSGAFEPLSESELDEWRELLVATGAHEAALKRLEDFRSADVLTVVTGQQAGAALGPLYVFWKALATIHWAREVQERTGRPCVPVFWVASDDHDIAEIAPVAWLGKEDAQHSVSLSTSESGGPAYGEKLDQDAVAAFLSEFTGSVNDTELLSGLLEDLQAAMGAGATFESQFLRLFNRWLSPLGILAVVPRLGFLRRRGARVIAREIASATSNDSIISRGLDMGKAGLPAPLHRSGDEANFFLDVDGVRGKVSRDGDRFVVSHPFRKETILATLEREELERLLSETAERFSPNVITRPLVQDAVFPNVAYVPGPGEFAYHGQIGGLYEEFDVPRPVLLPRPNVALLEPGTVRALNKLGLDASAAETATSDELREMLRAAAAGEAGVPAKLRGQLEAIEKRIDELAGTLGDTTKDTSIKKSLEKLKGSFETGASQLEGRVEHFLSVRDEAKRNAQERVMKTLFPGGVAQERAIGGLAPLFVRHGVRAIEELLRSIEFDSVGMQPKIIG